MILIFRDSVFWHVIKCVNLVDLKNCTEMMDPIRLYFMDLCNPAVENESDGMDLPCCWISNNAPGIQIYIT